MLMCAVVLGLALACRENPFAPVREPTAAPGADLTAPGPLTGCTRFRVHVQGRDSIVVVSTTGSDAGCGDVRPVLAGAAAFDRVTQRVRLPVAIANGSPGTLRPPAFVYAVPDSMRVLAAPGLAENSHTSDYLELANADSVASGSAGAPAGAAVWDYGRFLSTADPQTLPTDAHSATRWIEIAVKQGVSDFTVLVTAAGTRTGSPVPAVPPDTVPAGFWADTVTGYPCVSDMVVRNVIAIAFEREATQAQRQAVIDRVGGEVVGGNRELDEYYVRVPDEGTSAVLCRVDSILQTLPDVNQAYPLLMRPVDWHYRKPFDGPQYRVWKVRRNQPADRANWALEAIDAPLAWGCSVGQRSTPVAVVDGDFVPVHEVSVNVDRSSANYPMPAGLERHGTFIASIIGATGNDSVGVTGVMWRSSLRLFDPADEAAAKSPPRNPNAVALSVLHAAAGGAAVINLSMGMQWLRAPLSIQDSVHIDSMRVWEFAAKLIRSVRSLEFGNFHPLIVVAAGNDTLDAFWGGAAILADTFPDQVVVVSGMMANGAAYGGGGPRVTVAAPSEYVGGETADDNVIQWTGTSFAAPLVSGIAGLLLSFDPRLTAAQLKDLIVRGAERGGRSVLDRSSGRSIPVVDAYESLRLAGRRPGARLCGTPVWWDGTGINASRDGGPERLFEPGEAVFDLNARHGGENLQFFGWNSWSTRELHWGAGGWTETTPTWGPPQDGATYYSTLRYSHGLDSLVTAEVGVAGQATVYITPRGGARNPIDSVTVPTGTALPYACGWAIWGFCGDSVPLGTSTSASVQTAYSPMGDTVFVAVSRTATSTRIRTDWTTCLTVDGVPNDFGAVCREFETWSGPTSASVYALAVKQGWQPRLVHTYDSTEVQGLGIAEGGREWVAELERKASRNVTRYLQTPWNEFWWARSSTVTYAESGCSTDFRTMGDTLLEQHAIAGVCPGRGSATISRKRGAVIAGASGGPPQPAPLR